MDAQQNLHGPIYFGLSKTTLQLPGLVNVYSLRTWNGPVEIVDFPMKNGGFSIVM